MHRSQLNVLNDALGNSGTPRENVIPFRRPEAGAPVSASLSGPSPVQRSFAGLAEPAAQFDFGPGADVASMTGETARRRRRDVLAGLAGFAVLTLVAAVTLGGTVLVLINLLADIALLAYVMLLVKHNQRQIDVRNKVHPIRPVGYKPGVQAAPDYLVSRSSAR